MKKFSIILNVVLMLVVNWQFFCIQNRDSNIERKWEEIDYLNKQYDEYKILQDEYNKKCSECKHYDDCFTLATGKWLEKWKEADEEKFYKEYMGNAYEELRVEYMQLRQKYIDQLNL